MTIISFCEIYRKLSAVRREPSKGLPVLDEFVKTCREKKQDISSSDKWLAQADDCLYEIAASLTLFVAAVSTWLAIDEEVELAKALIHTASVRHLKQYVAVTYDLSSIEEEQSILTGCRLCTLNATPAISLGWALSLAVSYPTSERIDKAVEYLLQYHVDEYPRTTRRLLSSKESPFRAIEKANEALASLEEQKSWLKKLPWLREFAMTPEMRLIHSNLKRRETRAIHRHADEISIFSQIFTTQHFKYANKTAVEFVTGVKVQETTMEMSPYSWSVELPLSELTDPEHGVAKRRILWAGLPL
jgi:hypothetical protein